MMPNTGAKQMKGQSSKATKKYKNTKTPALKQCLLLCQPAQGNVNVCRSHAK
jgi:hypothetical protein